MTVSASCSSAAGKRPGWTNPLRPLARAAVPFVLASLVHVAVQAADPAVVGQWNSSNVWPIVPIHTNLLPNGKVLIFDSETDSLVNPRLWDPITDTMTEVPYRDGVNLFCAGHAPLPDGSIFVAGGHQAGYVGIRNATIFDWRTNTWTDVSPMAYARWYPTVTKLPDGRMLVVSGAESCSDCTIPGAPHDGIAAFPEIFDPSTGTWTTLTTASLRLPLYPHMIVLPDGRVFASGTQEDPIASQVLDLTTGTWSVVDPTARDGGSSVMYRSGKILKTGSARNPDYPTADAAADAWVIDMNQASPTWRQVASMAHPRTQHNLTLLPNGKVLATGGATNSDVSNQGLGVLPAELWNPDTDTWTTLASETVARLYHSIALLLPDGRVALAGGGHPPGFGIAEYRTEIYSPPYLFNGPRPVITSVQSTWTYGQTVFLETPDPAGVTSVALIAQGAVTHAFNDNQRYLPLTFSVTTGGLDVTAPANANLAPAGYYMLFVLNGSGVPSMASWVRFAAPWEDGEAPTAPTGLAATPSPGIVDLAWTASTDDTGVALYNVHRSTSSGFQPSGTNLIGQSPSASYRDTGFASGTYYYVVTAQDAAGNISGGSNQASATATADAIPPSTPSALVVSAAGPGQINVSWSPAVDNVGVSDYLIERCAGTGCDAYAQIGSTNALGFLDMGLAASTTYRYRLRAEDAGGNVSGYSNAAETTTSAPANGLVAAYSFNDGSASTAADVSGYLNDGTLTSGVTWSPQGRFGSALALPGNGPVVTVADSNSLDVTSGMTLEAWVYRTGALTGWQAIVAKDVDGYYLMASSDQSDVPAGGGTFTSGGNNLFGDSYIPVFTWTHLALVFDGSALNLYVNGNQVASKLQASPLAPTSSPLHIGGDHYGEYFPGLVDEVRIYDRGLSSSEIQEDMTTPVASGNVVLHVEKDDATDSVRLDWSDTAWNGVYRTRRGDAPTQPSFDAAHCSVVSGYAASDPSALHDGVDHYYLVESSSTCSP